MKKKLLWPSDVFYLTLFFRKVSLRLGISWSRYKALIQHRSTDDQCWDEQRHAGINRNWLMVSDRRHKHTVNAALTTGVNQKRLQCWNPITDGQNRNTSICLTVPAMQRSGNLQKLKRSSHLGGGGAEDGEGGGESRREKYVIVTLDYYTNPLHLDTLQRDG